PRAMPRDQHPRHSAQHQEANRPGESGEDVGHGQPADVPRPADRPTAGLALDWVTGLLHRFALLRRTTPLNNRLTWRGAHSNIVFSVHARDASASSEIPAD